MTPSQSHSVPAAPSQPPLSVHLFPPALLNKLIRNVRSVNGMSACTGNALTHSQKKRQMEYVAARMIVCRIIPCFLGSACDNVFNVGNAPTFGYRLKGMATIQKFHVNVTSLPSKPTVGAMLMPCARSSRLNSTR